VAQGVGPEFKPQYRKTRDHLLSADLTFLCLVFFFLVGGGSTETQGLMLAEQTLCL
jgi:hypothetical protein